jgi:AcrR family transcriptional regulator
MIICFHELQEMANSIMQILKELFLNNILIIAKTEFVKNGFNQTSMSNIAGQVRIATANIYHYFPNKDALFEEPVRPVIERWRLMVERFEKEIPQLVSEILSGHRNYDTSLLTDER